MANNDRDNEILKDCETRAEALTELILKLSASKALPIEEIQCIAAAWSSLNTMIYTVKGLRKDNEATLALLHQAIDKLSPQKQ